MNDVTIIIKTIERPQCLNKLIKSIRQFYPEIKIIVGDDSRNPVNRHDVYKCISFPYDIGASKGRNELIKKVDTKFVITIDDDMVFTEETDISLLKSILENSCLDILGIQIHGHYNTGMFQREEESLLCFLGEHEPGIDYVECDIIGQCFIAETNTMRKCKWEERAKTMEHFLFFYDYKDSIKVGSTPKVFINHEQSVETKEYKKLRDQDRVATDICKLWRERGIKHIKHFDKKRREVKSENWSDLMLKMYQAREDRLKEIRQTPE